MITRVGINGFGRIGRLALRRMMASASDLTPVAINAPNGDATSLAHVFTYDSIYGRWPGEVRAIGDSILSIDGHRIALTHSAHPLGCVWSAHGADLVLESSGAFPSRNDVDGHLEAGAQRVLVSAPLADADVTIARGVNDDSFDHERHFVVSGGSCTTNCLAPLASVIDDRFGVTSGMMTTIHAYTRDQEVLDGIHTDLRRARAAGENMIPTTTGAAQALGHVLPSLAGRFVGIAVRVPIATVSLLDICVSLRQETSVEEVNDACREAAISPRLHGVLGVASEPLVSSDYRGDPRSCVVDLASTRGAPGNAFKLLAWYDNEWAYACRTVEILSLMGAQAHVRRSAMA